MRSRQVLSSAYARLAALVLVPALAVSVVGCNGSGEVSGAAPQVTKLRVSGSGTCLPLLRILAADQPDKSVRLVFLPGLHSGGGIKGAIAGTLDIGAVSRDLSESERASGLKVTWLSKDGLAIAVNQSVASLGITGITSDQLRRVYAGEVTDWQQIGASRSLPIVVLDRHEDESAKIIMRQFAFKDLKITPQSVNLYYESDMVDALQTTTGAIGYFSLGYAKSQNVPVRLLSLDGVEPTTEHVASGAYEIVRPLGVVTKPDPPKEVAGFLAWATGDEARKLMLEKGYVPYFK